jgi:general secretion pathway protein B
VNLKGASPAVAKVTLPPAGKARVAAKTAAPRSAQPAAVQAAPAPMASLPEGAVAVPPAPSRPELKVSGIAWRGKGESSFAVVNGRAVLQGATVDGFKVLEIQKDLVRFSGSNGNVEVPLGEDEK